MGIKVKHSGGTATLSAAYAAGQGEARERARQRALQLYQLQLRDKQFRDQLAYGERRDEANRQHDLDRMDKQAGYNADIRQDDINARLNLAEIQNQNQANRDQRLHEYGQEDYQQRVQQERENAEFQNQLKKKNIKWEYSEKQKAEFQKYADGLVWLQEAEASGEISKEQADQMRVQSMAKLHGFEKVPVLETKEDQISAQDMFNSLRVKGPDGTEYMQDPKTGKYYDPQERVKLAERKAKDEQEKARIDFITGLLKERSADSGGSLYTYEQAASMWDQVEKGEIPENLTTSPTLDEYQVDRLDENWKASRDKLQGGFLGFGHASQEDMELFRRKFIAEAKSEGIDETLAEEYFMKKWASEVSNRGFFKNDKVPDLPGKIKKITSESEFKALPSGAIFIAPDGTKRRKP